MGTNGKPNVPPSEQVKRLNEKAATWKPDDGHPKHHEAVLDMAELLKSFHLDASKTFRMQGLTPTTRRLILHADRHIGPGDIVEGQPPGAPAAEASAPPQLPG